MAILDDYVRHLSLTKAEGSIAGYKGNVSEFIIYIEKSKIKFDKTTGKKIDKNDIYGYLHLLKSSKNSPVTIRRKIAAVTSFFRYLKKIDLVKVNIMLDLDKEDIPKIPERKANYFNVEECNVLINSIVSRNQVRDECIIKLFLNTGLRLSELVSLNINCVGKETVKVIGKGNKERLIAISNKAMILIQEYLLERRISDSEALFVSERGGRIDKQTVQRIVKRAIERGNLNPDGKGDMLVHILRHSFATASYQAGTDIRNLQVALGHKNLSTTQIYTQVSDEQLKEASERNPMNNII